MPAEVFPSFHWPAKRVNATFLSLNSEPSFLYIQVLSVSAKLDRIRSNKSLRKQAVNLFRSVSLFDFGILTISLCLLVFICFSPVCAQKAQTLCSLLHRVSSRLPVNLFDTESLFIIGLNEHSVVVMPAL